MISGAEDEVAQTVDEGAGGDGLNYIARNQGVDLIELFAEFGFIESNGDIAKAHHAAGGGELVLVAMLAEAGEFRHDEDRFAMTEGGKNGSHARMGNDHPGLDESLLEIRRREKLGKRNVPGLPAAFADLGKDVVARALRCPDIHHFHHAVEGLVGAYGYEDHGRWCRVNSERTPISSRQHIAEVFGAVFPGEVGPLCEP